MSWIAPLLYKRQEDSNHPRHRCGTPDRSRAVEVDGEVYPSITAAAKAIGKAHTAIFRKLKNGNARYV